MKRFLTILICVGSILVTANAMAKLKDCKWHYIATISGSSWYGTERSSDIKYTGRCTALTNSVCKRYSVSNIPSENVDGLNVWFKYYNGDIDRISAMSFYNSEYARFDYDLYGWKSTWDQRGSYVGVSKTYTYGVEQDSLYNDKTGARVYFQRNGNWFDYQLFPK